jgi:hypothetical protein
MRGENRVARTLTREEVERAAAEEQHCYYAAPEIDPAIVAWHEKWAASLIQTARAGLSAIMLNTTESAVRVEPLTGGVLLELRSNQPRYGGSKTVAMGPGEALRVAAEITSVAVKELHRLQGEARRLPAPKLTGAGGAGGGGVARQWPGDSDDPTPQLSEEGG